jgi:hypothetical protein
LRGGQVHKHQGTLLLDCSPALRKRSEITALFGIIIGGGVTFWHIFPKAKAKKEAIEEKEAIQKAQDEKITICPYCGGMTTGNKCEFCGMPLPDGEGMK